MEVTITDLLCIHPDKILSVIEPSFFKFLLTNRADRVCWIVWNWDILKFGLGGFGVLWTMGVVSCIDNLVLVNLARFNPRLYMC
jgi:hypothetical protein